MKLKESAEHLNRKQNIVIMWFGELWQWFYDMLKDTESNVYVVSVSGKNNKMYEEAEVHPYNRYEGFPVPYEDIDAVLLCCRTDQLEAIKTLIPKEVLPKVVDKVVSFQNGFNVREKLIEVFWKSPARCAPALSFKRYDGKKVNMTFAKPSPFKGNKNIQDLMDTINAYTVEKYGKVAFEPVDSIALNREWEYKAFMNAILNSLCVVYKGDVQHSLHQFKKEFGNNVIELFSQEISQVLNTKGNPILETNAGEVAYYLHQIIENFAHEKPSTYQQYYVSSQNRGKVLSEDDHLLGYIIQQARKHKISIPISTEIRNRMKHIEEEINTSLETH